MHKAALGMLMLLALAACGGSEDNSIDPNKQYRLAISAATIKATNNGTNWDVDASGPDTFARFTVDGVSADTTTVLDSYTPTWAPAQGVLVTAARLKGSGVTPVAVQLWDEDLTVDDTISSAFNVVLTDADLTAGQVTFAPFGGFDSVTFLIVAQ